MALGRLAIHAFAVIALFSQTVFTCSRPVPVLSPAPVPPQPQPARPPRWACCSGGTVVIEGQRSLE